jgi:acetoin utilization protein AcuB
MLSHRDLLEASLTSFDNEKTEFDRKRHLWTIPVEKVMRTHVVGISPSETIAHAAHIMRSRKIGALPVVENKKLVGIITESDLLRVLEETFDKLQ